MLEQGLSRAASSSAVCSAELGCVSVSVCVCIYMYIYTDTLKNQIILLQDDNATQIFQKHCHEGIGYIII